MTPHDVIVQLVGNTFGTGDEHANDVLGALNAAGFKVTAPDAGASPDRLGEAQRLADGENAYAMPRAQALALIDIAETLRDTAAFLNEIRNELHDWRTGQRL